MRKEEVLRRDEKGRNILHTVKKGRLTGLDTFCVGNCLVKYVIEGKLEKEERGRRRKQLLDDLNETKLY